MQHDHFLKEKKEFQPFERGGGTPRVEGLRSKYLLPFLPHLWFHLIWYETWPCFTKVEFWPMTLPPRSVGACRQNICYQVAVSVILFNVVCNMPIFWKKKMNFDLLRGGGGGGLPPAVKIFVTIFAAFVIPFNLIWNMTMFWKSWILTFDPTPKVSGGLQAKYLLPCCCIRDSI